MKATQKIIPCNMLTACFSKENLLSANVSRKLKHKNIGVLIEDGTKLLQMRLHLSVWRVGIRSTRVGKLKRYSKPHHANI
jgi:hypothetical protein